MLSSKKFELFDLLILLPLTERSLHKNISIASYRLYSANYSFNKYPKIIILYKIFTIFLIN